MFAEQLAAHVLQHVRQLHHDHQIGDQQQVTAFVTRYVQCQQRRDERHAEHGDHQPPLHLRCPFQKVRTVAAQGGEDRQQQEHVHRDEDREQPIPVGVDQQVLQRQGQVERGHQGRVVAASGGREGEKLAQGVERHRVEQQDHRAGAEPERDADHHHHHPPGVDAGVEVVDHGIRAATGAQLEDQADQRGDDQDRADAAK